MISYIPQAKADLDRFYLMLNKQKPFSFIRFSDGEMEIIRNRYVEIGEGYTIHKGKKLISNFPPFDKKKFDPDIHKNLRLDLMESAKNNQTNFFKGIPTFHNNLVCDRDYLVELNGGISEYLTFSDLLLNCNFPIYRKKIVPLFFQFKNIAVIANFRAKIHQNFTNSHHIKIGDNLFDDYQNTLESVMLKLIELPEFSLVLSSASSLSNIVGNKLFNIRPDLTFIDVGTSINDLLGLQSTTRAYHRLYFKNSFIDNIYVWRYKLTKEYRIRW